MDWTLEGQQDVARCRRDVLDGIIGRTDSLLCPRQLVYCWRGRQQWPWRLDRLDPGAGIVGKPLWFHVCEVANITEPPVAVVGVLANYNFITDSLGNIIVNSIK